MLSLALSLCLSLSLSLSRFGFFPSLSGERLSEGEVVETIGNAYVHEG